MEQVKKQLEGAFRTLCEISVRGEDVERMLAVKNALREVYARCGAVEKEQTEKLAALNEQLAALNEQNAALSERIEKGLKLTKEVGHADRR